MPGAALAGFETFDALFQHALSVFGLAESDPQAAELSAMLVQHVPLFADTGSDDAANAPPDGVAAIATALGAGLPAHAPPSGAAPPESPNATVATEFGNQLGTPVPLPAVPAGSTPVPASVPALPAPGPFTVPVPLPEPTGVFAPLVPLPEPAGAFITPPRALGQPVEPVGGNDSVPVLRMGPSAGHVGDLPTAAGAPPGPVVAAAATSAEGPRAPAVLTALTTVLPADTPPEAPVGAPAPVSEPGPLLEARPPVPTPPTSVPALASALPARTASPEHTPTVPASAGTVAAGPPEATVLEGRAPLPATATPTLLPARGEVPVPSNAAVEAPRPADAPRAAPVDLPRFTPLPDATVSPVTFAGRPASALVRTLLSEDKPATEPSNAPPPVNPPAVDAPEMRAASPFRLPVTAEQAMPPADSSEPPPAVEQLAERLEALRAARSSILPEQAAPRAAAAPQAVGLERLANAEIGPVTFTGAIDVPEQAARAESLGTGSGKATSLDRLPDQIVRSARFLVREHGGVVHLRLEPQALGRLTIHVMQDRDVVLIELAVQSHQVREVLQEQLPQLRQQLTDQGLVFHDLTISTEMEDRGEPTNRGDGQPTHTSQRGRMHDAAAPASVEGGPPTAVLLHGGRLDLVA